MDKKRTGRDKPISPEMEKIISELKCRFGSINAASKALGFPQKTLSDWSRIGFTRKNVEEAVILLIQDRLQSAQVTQLPLETAQAANA